MTNLPATLSTLDQQISALTEKLAPVTQDHVSDAMASMLKAGLSLPTNIDPDEAPMVYAFAMDGVSATGINRAATKLIRGEYNIRNRSFIPTPPELAAMARAETKVILSDLTRLRETKRSLTERVEPRNPEMAARAKALVANWRAQEAERKAVTEAPHEPMSAEKAEYYAAIMALNDKPGGPDASEAAFRRKIAAEVSTALPDERQAAE